MVPFKKCSLRCGIVTLTSLVTGLTIGSSLLSACGGSTVTPSHKSTGIGVYTSNERYTLAEEPLPTGSRLYIRAERYTHRGEPSSVLSTVEYDPRRRRAREGVVASIPVGERSGDRVEPLSLEVERECTGSHERIVAFGLLRDKRYTVVAQGRGSTTRLKKVPIPAVFHAGGVLVYARLASSPTSVIVRTPSGRVVSEMPFSVQAARCRS